MYYYLLDARSVNPEKFQINPKSGAITLIESLDFESQPQHVIIVTATDGTNVVSRTFPHDSFL